MKPTRSKRAATSDEESHKNRKIGTEGADVAKDARQRDGLSKPKRGAVEGGRGGAGHCTIFCRTLPIRAPMTHEGRSLRSDSDDRARPYITSVSIRPDNNENAAGVNYAHCERISRGDRIISGPR